MIEVHWNYVFYLIELDQRYLEMTQYCIWYILSIKIFIFNSLRQSLIILYFCFCICVALNLKIILKLTLFIVQSYELWFIR